MACALRVAISNRGDGSTSPYYGNSKEVMIRHSCKSFRTGGVGFLPRSRSYRDFTNKCYRKNETFRCTPTMFPLEY